MKITLLNVEKTGDNKDFNAGFGTAFQVGSSFGAKFLERMRYEREYLPLLSYGYLAAILKQNGHTVSYAINTIPKDADLIIMQCSLIRHNAELDFIKAIKKNTKAKIGLIGPFVSVRPDLFIEHADFIVKGEFEEVVLRMKGSYIPEGIVEGTPIQNLDILPFPNWSIFPVKLYSCRPLLPKMPFIFIQSSRGCSYSCNYCPYKVVGTYRERSIGNVIEEIQYLIKDYGIRSFMFRDPCFSFNTQRTIAFAEGIVKNKIKFEWCCETRLDRLDKKLVDLLYASGLRALKVGIESIDDNVLKFQKRKPINIKHQENIINYCDKKGISVLALYQLGLEEDTKESILKTIKYAKKLNTDFANFTICTPIPGTEYYDQIKDRICEKDWEKFNNFYPVFKHKNLSKDELIAFQEKAIVSYYIRPKLIFRHLLRSFKCY
ncbi:MAG: B12-binding domain-containing radical SAM protein [Candidatus Omnitrophica bacterium]|jgi:radical SAM superfamily enzyme YgiQ (UPF0313 family)|nr:B12-binding domain-containing radical SAM protein [Candidatus Omnitrophota bacterium]